MCGGGTLSPIPSLLSLPALLFLELYMRTQNPGQMLIQGWAFPMPAASGDKRPGTSRGPAALPGLAAGLVPAHPGF